MSKQRKFVQQLNQGGFVTQKSTEPEVPPDDSFSNFKISCVSEPIDYEQYLVRNKASIMNDPHRDLVLFPPDDVKVVRLQRTPASPVGSAPPSASIGELTRSSALARHVEVTTMPPCWTVVREPLARFRGAFSDLPKEPKVCELMGKPVEQWYAIDHVVDDVDAASAPSAVAMAPSRAVATLGGTRTTGPSRLWMSARRAALQTREGDPISMPDGANGSAEDADKPSTERALECDAVLCTRSVYQSQQRAREAALAFGAATATASLPFHLSGGGGGGLQRLRFTLRRLGSDDLARMRTLKGVGGGESCALPPLGLHLIAPVDWGLRPGGDSRNVIFLDAIGSVSGIGRHWLRLDRHTGTRLSRVASDRLESFFNSSPSSSPCNEAYLCFETTEARNVWVTAVKAALDAEQARQRLGYSVANGVERGTINGASAVTSGEEDGEARLPDGDSLRSSLQRFSQENELFVSHQRQQNRLNLLSVCPEIQVAYNSPTSSDCVRRRQQTAQLLEKELASDTRQNPRSPSPARSSASALRQFLVPECARETSKRRFLVTFLSLKSGLRTSLEDSSGFWEIDNPEPFFVSFFLASIADGTATRLSEDFWWNPNSALVDAMLPAEVFRRLPWHSAETAGRRPQAPLPPTSTGSGGRNMAPPPPIPLNPQGCLTANPAKLAKCRTALLSLDPGIRAQSLFLVFRVEKVLSGGIGAAAERYLKVAAGPQDAGNAPTSNDLKSGAALNRSMLAYCRTLGRYRMPFAWGSRWLFSKDTQVPLFKMDSSKVSEPALLQSVRQLARLLTTEASASATNSGYLPLTPAVLETLEKSIKAEVLPMQLHAAVNEVSTEAVTRSLANLVSSQLVVAQKPSEVERTSATASPLVLQNVTDFRPADEVVREVEVFVDRCVRSITGRRPYGAFESILLDGASSIVGGGSGYNSVRNSMVLFPENKRDSLRSETSLASSTAASDSNSHHSSRILRFSSSLIAKTASLDRNSISGIIAGGGDVHENCDSESLAAAAAAEEARALFTQPPLALVNPYRSFVHTLYVYPKVLNMAVKHTFTRARNLCCFMELRESDAPDAKALRVFYTRPSPLQPPFDTWFNTAVLHHDSTPRFLDEAKICLPIVLTPQHHLLFRFYHVRCDLNVSSTEKGSSIKKALESPTGYAWLPIINEDSSLVSGTVHLPICQDLPRDYLSTTAKIRGHSVANGNGASTNTGASSEPVWVDNKRVLFTVDLEPVSTMYSADPKLAQFFNTCVCKLSAYTNLVDSQARQSVRFSTVDNEDPIPSRPDTTSTRLDTTTGKLLNNAVKSLLLVESHSLVQFFPALANQLLEVLVVGSAMGQCESMPKGAVTPDLGLWLALCHDMVLGGACDVAKTSVLTLSVILCSIRDVLSSPISSGAGSSPALNNKPGLLKDFLEYSLDPSNLCSFVNENYKIPQAGSSGLYLHHATIRGMIAFLVDPSCPTEIAHRFLLNAWFFYTVVTKSLAQHLNASGRYKVDRKDWSRLSAAFKADLTVMLRLVGSWMVEMCSDRDAFVTDSYDTGSTRSNHTNVSSVLINGNGVDGATSDGLNAHSKSVEALGLELADSTADFLEQLLLLIDRGYVLQRLRDLLALLEIRHNMTPAEVDRFNGLRYRLLQRFSETQFFVQLNLPSLSTYISDLRERREEFWLSERFCEEHFVVGLTLQQVACVLAGCADAGPPSITSRRSLRQPLTLLLSQLAKLTFDPRYAGSKSQRARIHMLYLPLIKIALENIGSLGPPGHKIRELEKVVVRGRQADADSRTHSRGGGKAKKHKNGEKRSKKSISGRYAAGLGDGSVSSISVTTVTTNGSSSNSNSNESTSNASSANVDAMGNGKTASNAFIGPNGKVAPEVLNQIAGFGKGGALQRVRQRIHERKARFGSTATLTDAVKAEEIAEGASENSSGGHSGSYGNSNTTNGGGGGEDAASLGSDADYNSDIDENDENWPERVLEVAGVLPTDTRRFSNGEKPNGLPPAPKLRNPPPKIRTAPTNSTIAVVEPPKKPTTMPATRFRIQPSQFEYTFRRHIHRRPNVAEQIQLNDKIQRDLYICLLHLLDNMSEDPIVVLLKSLSDAERADFLKLLVYAVRHLKYRGRRCIARFNTISNSSVAQRGTLGSSWKGGDSNSDYTVLLEANMSTEAGLIVLDVLSLISNTFRRELENGQASSALFQGILDVYVCLLSTGQSERLLKHAFASLRVFISRYAKVLFSETTEGLARVCMAGLRISNLNLLPSASSTFTDADSANISALVKPLNGNASSGVIFDASSVPHISGLRLEACGLIYRLWRASFEVFGARGFKRVHLQMIIALSKLVGDIGPEFEASLSLLHSLTEMDMARSRSGNGAFFIDGGNHTRSISQVASMQAPLSGSSAAAFLEGIEDLIKRIRTVLTATEEMRRYGNDPYRQIDLQYSLAKSYASNPVLRRTWLEKLAELHLAQKNMAEVAMAKLHVAALMAEYLHKRGEFPQGCDAFCKVSANIRLEESSQLCDPAIIELSYNQEDMLRDVTDAATALEAAGLYEALQPVYALITPVYEARRDFSSLARIYHHLGRAYENTAKAEASAQRLFASYFRVAFYGKAFESLAGKVFIYRAEAWQKLNAFLEALVAVHEELLGRGRVERLVENYVDVARLPPERAFIQVTFVEPYLPLEDSGDGDVQKTAFELHHDVREFFFETPFIMQPGMSADACLMSSGPKRTDDLTAQWKRRTLLTTEAVFPHLRSRLEVVSSRDIDLSPLDAAIDAIQLKVRELRAHIPCAPQQTANSSALHLSTTSNQRGVVVSSGAAVTPVAEVCEVEVTAKGERRVPLLLDMQLQGALLPTVNQGPMAYAHAFLGVQSARLHPPERIYRLKTLFFDFLTACLVLLTRYRALMLRVHPEKYGALREAFDRYRVDLSNLLNEEVVVDETRLRVGPKSLLAGSS